jgi:hypothetical protein
MKRFRIQSVCLLSLLALSIHAAEVRFGHDNSGQVWVEYNPASGYVRIPFEIVNDNIGVEYARATLNPPKGVPSRHSSGLLGLFRHGGNSNRWSSLSDMIAGQTGGRANVYVAFDGNQGYVHDGWEQRVEGDGSVTVEPQYPGHNLEEDWVDNTHDGNHTSKGYLAIGSWLYDGDGDTNNFSLTDVAPGDAVPYIGTNLMENAVSVVDSQGFTLPATPGRFLDLRVSPVITAELHTAVEIRWNSQSGRVYQVEWTENLHSNQWHELGGTVTATGETMRAFDSITASNRFFRVRTGIE